MAGKRITLFDDDQWPGEGFGVPMSIKPESTVLGVIDVQHYAIDSNSDVAGVLRKHDPELRENLEARIAAMIDNITALQTSFRNAGNRIFYTRHGRLLADGADMIERRRGRERMAGARRDDLRLARR